MLRGPCCGQALRAWVFYAGLSLLLRDSGGLRKGAVEPGAVPPDSTQLPFSWGRVPQDPPRWSAAALLLGNSVRAQSGVRRSGIWKLRVTGAQGPRPTDCTGMDQYCILGRIGEGAHGIVFKAKHVEVRPDRGRKPGGGVPPPPSG